MYAITIKENRGETKRTRNLELDHDDDDGITV